MSFVITLTKWRGGVPLDVYAGDVMGARNEPSWTRLWLRNRLFSVRVLQDAEEIMRWKAEAMAQAQPVPFVIEPQP
jgi:hypothetical protein